jgi:nicotinamide-nucleotide amidase
VSPGGQAAAGRLAKALVAAFPGDLFARDDERPVEEIVLDLCRAQGLRLATAESCTGGMIGARLTGVAGSSDVFVGGVVAYSDAVKQHQLGVPAALLEEHGAVSAEVGAAMAAGARGALGADLAVADTGIAGPAGGTAEKPVGLVFLALDGPAGAHTMRVQLAGDRETIRLRATALALHMVRRELSRKGTDSREGDR